MSNMRTYEIKTRGNLKRQRYLDFMAAAVADTLDDDFL